MPISAPDLQALGKVSLDDYMRKTVVDQIAVETPLLKKLMSRRKLFLGAKQNVTVNVRKSHDSNFAWAYGEAAVGFNKRNTTDQAAFPWRRAVDGFYIPHDTLFGNGIKVREGERGQYKLETEERVQLVQLLDEQMEAFRTGFMEKLSLELHRDGTSSTDAVTGLDGLITNLGSLVLPGAIGKGAKYLTKICELKKINPAWFRKIAEEVTGIVSSAAGIHSKLGEEKLKESDRYKGAAANALGNIAGGYGLPKLLEQFGKKTGMGKMTGKVLKDYQEGRIGAKQVEKFLIETAAGMGKDALGAVNNVISLNAGSSQLYDLYNNPNNIAKLIVSEAGLNAGKTHAGKHQDSRSVLE